MANKKNGTSSPASEWTYKDWYERNKEGLAERRRSRYHEDKKYRTKVLAQNKSYRDKISEERAPVAKTKVRIPKHRKPVTMAIALNGKTTSAQLVHIGAFARAVGRSVPTIHQWERLGLLPRTPYSLDGKSKKERLYTADMVNVVIGVLKLRGSMVSSSDPTFRQEVVDGWEASGTCLGGKKPNGKPVAKRKTKAVRNGVTI